MKILRSAGSPVFQNLHSVWITPFPAERTRTPLVHGRLRRNQTHQTSIHGGGRLQFWHFTCQILSHLTLYAVACVAHHHWSPSCYGHRCSDICLKLSLCEGHSWGTSPSARHVPCVSEDGLEFEFGFEYLPSYHANRPLCSKPPCFEIRELVVAKIGGESWDKEIGGVQTPRKRSW